MTCGAKLPMAAGGLLLCGEPAVAVHIYRCGCGLHVREGATCPAHLPVPGKVGCARCLLEEGHECPMTAELVS